MISLTFVFPLFTAFTLVSSSSHTRSLDFGSLVLHESLSSPPQGFVKSTLAPSDETLNFRVVLTQSNVSGLEERLYDVSTPSSQNYGKYLSKAEVESYIRPSNETTSGVTSWLTLNNISYSTVSPAGDMLSFALSVAQANSLLGADYTIFEHQDTGTQTIRTMQYSIPQELVGHISLVHPTTSFPDPYAYAPKFSVPLAAQGAQNYSTSAPSSCATNITPACLQDLYGIPTASANQSSNTLGVTGFIDQYANKADLKQFLGKYRPDMNDSTAFSLESVDGGINSQDPSEAGYEGNLDIQYTVGLATGVPIEFISVKNQTMDALQPFVDIINYLLGQDSPPQVLSSSYAFNEALVSSEWAHNLCNSYMQLGARGVTLVFGSGDGGVGGALQNATCSGAFQATFPSSCPYVTSVGGTTGVSPEVAASLSSGGFSNYFSIPPYQASVVSAYKSALGSTNSGLYNSSGRGFPDIAAQALNVQTVLAGHNRTINGTSCSTPIFSSIVSLLNDELIGAGKSPLGFLNPLLYSIGASAFTDITAGSNPGCNTDGYPAMVGWDAITGLGTPNYDKLRTVVGL